MPKVNFFVKDLLTKQTGGHDLIWDPALTSLSPLPGRRQKMWELVHWLKDTAKEDGCHRWPQATEGQP